MDIYEEYKNEPFYEMKFKLSNNFDLYIKWNIFKDKKDNFKKVMRTRYVLLNENNERESLKILGLSKDKVNFKQIEISERIEQVLMNVTNIEEKKEIIFSFFETWLREDFIKMFESSDLSISIFSLLDMMVSIDTL